MISIVSLEIQKILKRKFILILLAIYSAILLLWHMQDIRTVIHRF